MSKLFFSQLLTIYRECKFDANGKGASLSVNNQDVFDALQVALTDENLEDSGIGSDVDLDQINIGDSVRIWLGDHKIKLGYLARNFNDLIPMRRAAFMEPKDYFLIEEAFAKGDDNPPPAVIRYRKVLQFLNILIKSVAYLDKDRGELVFIKGGKYTVPIEYTSGELASVDLAALDKVLEQFADDGDAYEEQKLEILKEAALGLIEDVGASRRFRTLLFEMTELCEKFADGYKLYLTNFSYDKVRDELQAWKVDYTSKIHKAFAEIQSQLLSIPVATVIVATQLKLAKAGELANFLGNVAVVIGCWIFCALFLLLCRNQFTTLSVLKAEISRQESKMKADYETVLAMKDFHGVFDSLNKRVTDQQQILWGVLIVLATCLILAHLFFWKLTGPYLLS